jgi:hypothetical protein
MNFTEEEKKYLIRNIERLAARKVWPAGIREIDTPKAMALRDKIELEEEPELTRLERDVLKGITAYTINIVHDYTIPAYERRGNAEYKAAVEDKLKLVKRIRNKLMGKKGRK